MCPVRDVTYVSVRSAPDPQQEAYRLWFGTLFVEFGTFPFRSCSSPLKLGNGARSQALPPRTCGVVLHDNERLMTAHCHDLLLAAPRLGKSSARGVPQPMEVKMSEPGLVEGRAEVLTEARLV